MAAAVAVQEEGEDAAIIAKAAATMAYFDAIDWGRWVWWGFGSGCGEG